MGKINYRKKKPSVTTVLLIDGQCLLCNGITRFIVKRDKAAIFQFASLQSKAGQQFLISGGIPIGDLNTFVMIENGQYFIKSTAALRVLRQLDGFWPLSYIFIIVPRPLRNLVYDWIARNRYRWFGREEVCMLPSAPLMGRFIENGVQAADSEHEGIE